MSRPTVIARLRNPRQFISTAILRSGLGSRWSMEVDGIKLRCFPTSASIVLFQRRNAYSADMEFFRKYLKPSDNVVDVGANIGVLAITAGICIPGGRVLAFEANPRTCGFLAENLQSNRMCNVECHNLALGDHAGTVQIVEPQGDDTQSHVSNDAGTHPVPLVRLDTVIPREMLVALLKIDTEGFERFVLDGASGILDNVRSIYIEVSEVNFGRYGYQTPDLLSMLAASGFECLREKGRRWLRVPAKYVPSEAAENVLAVRNVDEFCLQTGYTVN